MSHYAGILLIACALASQAAAQTIKKDIVYGNADGVELLLDMAQPASGKGPFPAIVCLHGGAWQVGNRAEMHPLLPLLADKGYVAVSVEYRLTNKYRWPAQIEDAKCAVRFLRDKAKTYKIDPRHIGALGISAGGHLALLLGLTEPKDKLEGQGGHAAQSSKVQAVVNCFGPTDLPHWTPHPVAELILRAAAGGKGSDALLVDFIGTSDRQAPIMAQASPITYIGPGDAPILTMHGALDPLVPLDQATLLHEALKKANVTEQLVVIPGAFHGWQGTELDRSKKLAIEFFDKHLKTAQK